MNNREKILQNSIEFFNQEGIVAVTTNHICKFLQISPGNLYFHFRSKEEILYELFERMCEETYESWKPASLKPNEQSPLELVNSSLEVFWKYRFFHREMYHLRRKDPKLNSRWQKHIQKTHHHMGAAFLLWQRKKFFIKIQDKNTQIILRDALLVTANSFFQFYESKEKPANRKNLQLAKQYLKNFLQPYFTAKYLEEITLA